MLNQEAHCQTFEDMQKKQAASLTQQAQAAIKNEAEILKCEHHGLAHQRAAIPRRAKRGHHTCPRVPRDGTAVLTGAVVMVRLKDWGNPVGQQRESRYQDRREPV